MSHPKRQQSKSRSRKRRTNTGLKVTTAAQSNSGSKSGVSHRICPVTGCYKGQQVVTKKTKAE